MKKYRKLLLTALVFAVLSIGIFGTVSTVSAAAKNGWVTEKGSRYYYVNGKKQTGLLKPSVSGEAYYYYLDPKKSGAAVKSQIVTLNKKNYYFDASYHLVRNSHSVRVGSNYYYASATGQLKKVSLVEYYAGYRLDKCGSIRNAFMWSANLKYVGSLPANYKTPANYAFYGFVKGAGDCKVQAATFYYMAKAAGFDAKYKSGYVTNRTMTAKPNVHAWVQITTKAGANYVFDPNFVSYVQKNLKVTYAKAVQLSYNFPYTAYRDKQHLVYCSTPGIPILK